jgi:hypothetical protein
MDDPDAEMRDFLLDFSFEDTGTDRVIMLTTVTRDLTSATTDSEPQVEEQSVAGSLGASSAEKTMNPTEPTEGGKESLSSTRHVLFRPKGSISVCARLLTQYPIQNPVS